METSTTHAVVEVVTSNGQHLPDVPVIEGKSQVPTERLLTIEDVRYAGLRPNR